MLLPLSDFLNVPPQCLQLVVDNARSPRRPVSFQKRRRRLPRRSHSLDESDPLNRWSSIVPLLPHADDESDISESDGGEDTILQSPKSSHRRACSLDGGFSPTTRSKSGPMRIPRRRQSPPPSPLSVRSPPPLRIPVRRASPKAVKKPSASGTISVEKLLGRVEGTSDKTSCYSLLSFPSLELRQEPIVEEQENKYTAVASRIDFANDATNFTTADVLKKALETMHSVD